ncbi:MAG: hypothetical protein H8E62_03570 [Planctomycetes bacterium]|nr:hypothetical protein [Planctomycetota bacterium]
MFTDACKVVLGLALCGIVSCVGSTESKDTAAPTTTFDKYGGCTDIKGSQTGFFHTEKLGSRWLWITPDGHGFVPIGASIVGMQPQSWNGADRHGKSHMDHCLHKYGSLAEWEKATALRFRDWGFNYTGYYTHNDLKSQGIPTVVTLNLTSYAFDERWAVAGNVWYEQNLNFRLPDVFNPSVAAYASKRMREVVPDPADPMILALYADEPDNLKGFSPTHPHLGLAILVGEMQIGPGAGRAAESDKQKLFANFTKTALITTLTRQYVAIDKLNAAWGTTFKSFKELEQIRYDHQTWGDRRNPLREGYPSYRKDLDNAVVMFARQYARVINDAVRGWDSNHALGIQLYGASVAKGGTGVLPAIASGFTGVGAFDFYATDFGSDSYELLKRPFTRIFYLNANPDSPLRFQGTIDDWVVCEDAQGNKPAPKGKYLKIYDDAADIWFKLKFAGWRLPVRITGMTAQRGTIHDFGNGQVLYSGKNPEGRSWFTVRSSNPHNTGHVTEWADSLAALRKKNKKAEYIRSTAVEGWNFSTQEERGKFWAERVNNLVDIKSSSGDHYVCGVEQWKWMDNGWTYWLEQINFGLVSLRDNAYDGQEATRLGADGKPGTWDDEVRDYGDAISAMRNANRNILGRLRQSVGE